jgi:hypothetical protein
MRLKGYAVGTRKPPRVGQIRAVSSDTSRKENHEDPDRQG